MVLSTTSSPEAQKKSNKTTVTLDCLFYPRLLQLNMFIGNGFHVLPSPDFPSLLLIALVCSQEMFVFALWSSGVSSGAWENNKCFVPRFSHVYSVLPLEGKIR